MRHLDHSEEKCMSFHREYVVSSEDVIHEVSPEVRIPKGKIFAALAKHFSTFSDIAVPPAGRGAMNEDTEEENAA